jgi:hypothetical protein
MKTGYLIVSGIVKKCIFIYSQSENHIFFERSQSENHVQCHRWKYLNVSNV